MKSKMFLHLVPVCCVALLCSFVGRDPQWFERRMGELEKAARIPNEAERIDELGKFLGVGLQGGMDAEQQQLFDKAQSALLSIPGYARNYQDKIESLRAQAILNFNRPEEELDRLRLEGAVVEEGDYNDFRKKAFGVLGLLPSSEAVAVLGHFLNDPEGRDRKDLFGRPLIGSDYVYFGRNCVAASIALSNLGIDQPPFRNEKTHRTNYTTFYMTEEEIKEVDAWKDWWNEIKDGRRTYRFIGSNIEYGPDGPASKEVVQRVERDRKRDEERASRSSKNGSVQIGGLERFTSSPGSLAGIIAVVFGIIAAGWYFWKRA